MNKILYGTCCNYAYTCLRKLQIKEYRSQDVVNEFFFENEVNFDNYKSLIYQTIKKLQLKPLIRYQTEYTPKAIHIDEQQSQCHVCNKIKPIDYFYIHRFKPVKNCKECITKKAREDYQIKTAHRILNKKNKDIKTINEMIELLQKRKQELQ